MGKKKYEKRVKEDKPVLAICYDFDKTLSPDDMQAQGYIQSVGYEIPDFWTESNALADDNDMDQNLAYMYKMMQEAEGNFVFNKKALNEYGAKVALFPGVECWFDRIKKYGESKNVIVEHYIISSGLKEMIEGTTVAQAGAFEKIYASSFYYNERGVAVWPAQVVNYTNKTQFLFRIEKGILDINDPAVNDYFRPEEIRVPFRNMIYIGDSDTDVPCMKLVNSYGGHSIGVYNSQTKDKTKVYKMMRDNRIRYFAEADYTEGSELDLLVKAIIDRTASNEALEAKFYQYKNECMEAENACDKSAKKRHEQIAALEESRSFATTHAVIADLAENDHWEDTEIRMLMKIGAKNRQVFYILNDPDVRSFFEELLSKIQQKDKYAQRVEKKIKSEES